MVWAIDFQFDSTIDGNAVKVTSMFDEHTCESLNLVERSITGERLVEELTDVYAAAGGPPKVPRMDNGLEMVLQALRRFCENKTGVVYIPPGCPGGRRLHRVVQQQAPKECLNRNYWNTPFKARVVISDFKHEHSHRHRHSALGYRTPAEYAAACRCTHTPVSCDIN